jgi:hypothetical protein
MSFICRSVHAYAILLPMKPATGGYTLLEVMLFFAVSSMLLAIFNVALRGQGAHTEFVASMNETASKMQQWIDEVKNGYSASTASSSLASGNFNCTLDLGNRPQLTLSGSGHGTGSNVDCIFLGKAIMINDEFGTPGPTNVNDKIYAYTVLGRRTYTDSNGNQVLVDNIIHANPGAAIYDLNPTDTIPDTGTNLTEVYKIPNGARVRRVYSDPYSRQTNNLAGFFIDPSSSNNSLVAVQYPLKRNINPAALDSSPWNIRDCIELTLSPQCRPNGSTPDNLWPMGTWYICFESTRNDERALLQVISNDGAGANTKMNIGRGDQVCS